MNGLSNSKVGLNHILFIYESLTLSWNQVLMEFYQLCVEEISSWNFTNFVYKPVTIRFP